MRLILLSVVVISTVGCARIVGESNQETHTSPPCSNNYTSLHLWSNEGNQLCLSGDGFVDFRNYCQQGFWPYPCVQTWEKDVSSFVARDESGVFIAAYFDPKTGAPQGSKYEYFYSGSYQPWASQIVRDAYGVQISYDPVIR